MLWYNGIFYHRNLGIMFDCTCLISKWKSDLSESQSHFNAPYEDICCCCCWCISVEKEIFNFFLLFTCDAFAFCCMFGYSLQLQVHDKMERLKMFFMLLCLIKVATHEGTGRRNQSQGPVPATKSHRVNRPIFVKNPVAGTEFWSPKSVPRIQTGLNSWDQSQGLVPTIFCLVPRVNRVVGLVPATN